MKFLSQRLREAKGFTLVELMVVVAIIGILSAVAIPNFRKYQAKSKTSEAKLQLASIYTAESSFLSDFDGYASCLAYMGYNPSNEYLQRYYTTGISGVQAAADGQVIASNGALTGTTVGTCVTTSVQGASLFQAGKPIGSTTQSTYDKTMIAGTNATELGFTAQAVGAIDKNFTASANADLWSIDSNKSVKQIRLGY